jgi:hypothetical protein
MQMPEKLNAMISRVQEGIGELARLKNLQVREKIITAVCRTVDGIEWTSLKIKQDGTEPLQQDSATVAFSGETAEEIMASIELPEAMEQNIKGDVIVPLRTAELLMRVMELPATQDDEITDMIGFQIDKISPFPADQIAISHEVLQQSEDSSLVLMAAAKRSCIDSIGDAFEAKGIQIHSIDSRDLGWMQLLNDGDHISQQGCEIIIFDDGIEFSLVVVNDGIPIAFRMLHAQAAKENVAEELAYEIGYTLTSLDAEHDLEPPTAIQYWSRDKLSTPLRTQLAEKCGMAIHPHSLNDLPPLSEGIIRRALADGNRIELIPREWIEHEKNKRLRKKTIIASSVIAGLWLVILLGFFTTYKIRDIQLSSAKKQALAVEPAGEQALENRRKLKALQVYTDRSDSALECLREVTRMLPSGDIEFLSYNYNKEKGVTLRGSSSNDNLVDDFGETLASSPLFEELKNQSSSAKTTKGVRRSIFSVTLVLPSEEEEK